MAVTVSLPCWSFLLPGEPMHCEGGEELGGLAHTLCLQEVLCLGPSCFSLKVREWKVV